MSDKKSSVSVIVGVTCIALIVIGLVWLVIWASLQEMDANQQRAKQNRECYEACWPRAQQSCFWSDGKLWAACATEDEPEVVEVQHE